MTDNKHGVGRRAFLGMVAGGLPAVAAAAGDPAAKPGPAAFSFGVIADPHAAEGPRAGIEHLGNGVDKFLRCLQRFAEMDPTERPAFVLIVGDVHPEALEGRLDGWPFTLHAVAGNHEGSVERRARLRALFPHDFIVGGEERDYYSFTHGGVRFIGLCDAGMGGEHVGQFCSELINPRGQCAWLEAELAREEPRKVVFAHIPPHPEGRDLNMYLSRNDARWFEQVLRRHAPEVMFFGHLHRPTEAYRFGGVQAWNVRSCCWNSGDPAVGCLHVAVSGDGMAVRELITGRPADGAAS